MIDMDLLRIYFDHNECLDHYDGRQLLERALRGCGNPRVVWEQIKPLVGELRNLDSKIALDKMKEAGDWAGGHEPQDAYNLIAAQLEQQIAETVLLTATLAKSAAA